MQNIYTAIITLSLNVSNKISMPVQKNVILTIVAES